MKRHLLWGEYRTLTVTKSGKKAKVKIWEPVDKLQEMTGRFWMAENVWSAPSKKNNYNLKIFYQRTTARQIFYQDPNFYYEIQGIQKNSPTWEKLNAYYCMKKLKKELPEFQKDSKGNTRFKMAKGGYMSKPYMIIFDELISQAKQCSSYTDVQNAFTQQLKPMLNQTNIDVVHQDAAPS